MMHILEVQLAPIANHPQYGMSFNYHYNRNEFVSANQSELASLTPESDRANLGNVSTIFPTATCTSNSVHVSRTDHETTTLCVFHLILWRCLTL